VIAILSPQEFSSLEEKEKLCYPPSKYDRNFVPGPSFSWKKKTFTGSPETVFKRRKAFDLSGPERAKLQKEILISDWGGINPLAEGGKSLGSFYAGTQSPNLFRREWGSK